MNEMSYFSLPDCVPPRWEKVVRNMRKGIWPFAKEGVILLLRT